MVWVEKRELIFSKDNKFYKGLFWVNKRAVRDLGNYGHIIKGKSKLIKVLKEV